jgi:hypothetical protein
MCRTQVRSRLQEQRPHRRKLTSNAGVLDEELKTGSATTGFATYAQTKFVNLLAAHWWRRQLTGVCNVVAVSPGLIPGTGLMRSSSVKIPTDLPDAKSVPEGKANRVSLQGVI